MGYNTLFTGELRFTRELTGTELAHLKSFFDEDAREHPEWDNEGDFNYIDLKLCDDFGGIRWNDETEKTRGMVDAVNFIIKEMKKKAPDFGLTGSFLAQGEEIDDRWQLVIEDGKAEAVDIQTSGTKTECPECGHKFYTEEAQ